MLVRAIALLTVTGFVSTIAWDYGKNGADWSEEGMCSKGGTQSPVNLPMTAPTALDELTMFLKYPKMDSALTVYHNGNSIAITLPETFRGGFGVGKGSADVEAFQSENADAYRLWQINFHSPSEHTINGHHYPLEVQCHHVMEHSGHKRAGVLSTLYEVGTNGDGIETYSPFIEGIVDKLPTATTKSSVSNFHFTPLGSAGATRYHSYKGSATIGGCMENVDWYVMYDPTSISKVQYVQLFGTMGDAGWKRPRPLQPLFGRHPDGCHHHAVEAGAAIPRSFLSFALAVFSLVFSS